MNTIGRMIGYVLWIGSGILTFIFWFMALSKWLGLFGKFLAITTAPGIIIFPIVFWIVEGVFPTFYFIVWGTGILGIIILGISSRND